jgi:hypothetical protein
MKAGLMLLSSLLFLSSLLLPQNLLATSGPSRGSAEASMVAPSISVSDAVGANPGTVYTSGQTPRTVSVAWNAGSDYTYCEVYFTVNDADQKELGRGHDGVKPITVTAGNAYHFWMVIYPGGGQIKVVTELRVVAEKRIEADPPASASAPDVTDAVSDRAPVDRVYRVPINNVRVESGPRHVIIRFNGHPNAIPYVAIGRGPAIYRNNELVFGDNLVGGGAVGINTVTNAEKAKGQYMFASAVGTSFSEDGLDPGRTYYYVITIPGPGGRPYQATGKFSMLGETTKVTVVWEKVRIDDDSDDLSTGEVDFRFWHNFGQPSGKFFEHRIGDADTDHTYDLNRIVVIDNASNTLSLSASGRDDDGGPMAPFESDDKDPYTSPASNTASDKNVAKGVFDLSQYADNTRVPFQLSSMAGGALQFVVSGHFEIIHVTAQNIGTTSSGLTTAPAAQTVRAQGRVKLGGATGKSTLTMCEAAKQARARNSPAAPGLEAKCLEEQKRELPTKAKR